MNEATKKLLHARVYGHFVMVLVYMDLIKKYMSIMKLKEKIDFDSFVWHTTVIKISMIFTTSKKVLDTLLIFAKE